MFDYQNGNLYGKIYQYDLDGKFIAEYDSIGHCSDITGCSYDTVKRTIDGNKPLHSKFIYTNIFYIKLPKDYLKIKLHTNSKKLYQYDLDGNFVKEWDNLTLAAKEYNLSKSYLSNVIKQRYCNTKLAVGYQWSYDKFDKIEPHVNKMKRKIVQYDLNGNFVKEWDSKLQAIKFYNNQGIRSCVEGKSKSKQSCGYIWKYKD